MHTQQESPYSEPEHAEAVWLHSPLWSPLSHAQKAPETVCSSTVIVQIKSGHQHEAMHLFMGSSVIVCVLNKGISLIITLGLDIRNGHLFLTFSNFYTITITLPVTIDFKFIYY